MFSGIGGFDLALNRQGHECIGYSEIDKYAIQTYKKNFGEGLINYGDATKINADELPDFDLLCGGFPCQAFSVAGKRRGFEDTRGTLFFDIARIAKSKRPRYLLLENVKGLLNHNKGETFRIILETLGELGYRVEYGVLNSRYFGVPQNRERVFIIGSLGGESRTKVFPFRQNTTQSNGKIASTTIDANYWKGIDNHGARTGIMVVDGQNNYIRKDGIVGSLQAQAEAKQTYGFKIIQSGTWRTHKDGNGFRKMKDLISPTIPARAREDGSGQPCIKFKTDGEPSFTLNTQDKHGVYDGVKIRRLTPLECERLQGYPDNWTEGCSDTQRYKQCGNSVTVNVVEAIAKRLRVCK